MRCKALDKVIGVGIVGAGCMGAQIHAAQYTKLENVKIVGICDRDKGRAEEAAGRFSAKGFSELDDLLKMPKLDMVDVCTPTPWHEEPVVKAAEAGKHVLCEKPIALTLKAADRMIKAAKAANVKFMVAQCVRFDPGYGTAKKMIDTGELGKPLLATASRRTPMPSWSNWYADPKISGGAVIDLAIHDIDYLNWILGHPSWIAGRGIRGAGGAWDHVISIIGYKEGGTGSEQASFHMPRSFTFATHMSIMCEKGDIEIKSENLIPSLKVHKVDEELPEAPQLPEKDGYHAEIEYFINCIKHDEVPTMITPKDARLALETALAARKSIETGRTVGLSL